MGRSFMLRMRSFRAYVLQTLGMEGNGYPRERCQDAKSRDEKAIDSSRIYLVTKDQKDLEFLISRWSILRATRLLLLGLSSDVC